MIRFDLVASFDEAVDELLERFRGDPVLDRLMTTATRAGEFSLLWHVASAARGAVRRRPDQVVALAVGIAAESLLVNQVLKRWFRRERPTPSGDERYDLRTPLTSSFPSGHASAATFAAVCLIGWDGRRSAIVWIPLAAAVAASRPYVRIHHASDVVGGVVVGGLLGWLARRVFRRFGLT
ncbi:MAG: hypothetical protein RLZZ01_1486 [Actinomycetota bacterium]